jgi:hypothetical protein
MVLLWRVRDHSFSDLCFPVATATLLVLPYSFVYDMPVATLGFAVLIYSRWGVFSALERTIAAYALCATIFTPFGLVPLLLLGGLWLQVRSVERTGAVVRSAPA